MKQRFTKMYFLFAVLLTISSAASAQIYITVRPTAPIIVKTPQPNPTYIWVNEEWEPEGKTYKYIGGHWEAPPQNGYYHKQGYWKSNSKGVVWVKGNWYMKQSKDYAKHKDNGKHKGNYKNNNKHEH